MDKLDDLLAGTTIGTTVQVPKVGEIRKIFAIETLEEERKELQDECVLMAKLGFERCSEMGVVLEPNIQAKYMQIQNKVVDGRTLSVGEVIYPPIEQAGEEVNDAGKNTPDAAANAGVDVETSLAGSNVEAETRENEN